jgi:hypothetical protein
MLVILQLQAAPAYATRAVGDPGCRPLIQIEDVARFFEAHDAAGGHPTAEQLQRDYLNAGSNGLHGYWVGYRIVKAYYQQASDKRRAIREILEMSDPKAFLAKSGWYPGIRLR